MAIALVQSRKAVVTGVDSQALSFSATPTVGNWVIVKAATYSGDLGESAASDNQSNTYARRGYVPLAGMNTYLAVYAAPITTASGTFTVTVNPTGSSADLTFIIEEWSGISSFDKAVNADSTSDSTSATTGNITPAENNEALFAALTHAGANMSITPTNGTQVDENEGGSSNMPISSTYKVQTTATTEAMTWTLGTATHWGCCVVAFKAASTGVNGTASITLGEMTCSAAGAVDVSGSASVTLGGLTCSAAGVVEVAGNASITLGELTCSAAGTVTTITITGAADITLDALACNASGTVDVIGTADITLAALTCAADGTVGATAITGTADILLDPLTASGAGAVEIAGTASISLETVTCSADGVVGFTPISGEATITLAALISSAAGAVEISGVVGITLNELMLNAEGSIGSAPIEGAGNITFDLLSSQGTGAVQVTGTLAGLLGDVLSVATGLVSISGTGSFILDSISLVGIAQAVTVALNGVTASMVQRRYNSQVVQRSNQGSVIERENQAGIDQQELNVAVIQILYDAESEDGL